MTFNSLEFFLFFPIVATLYFLLPHKYRHVHLLIASCVFYMAVFPEHVFVILFIVMMNYMGGLLIEGVPSPWKKGVLTVGIILNLSTLFLFKYVNFFSDTVYHLLRIFHIAASGKPIMNLLLPLGLSFMTLRSISYLVEVYRNRMPAEKNPAFFSATMLFFPTLINGPIEKPNLFNAQFKEVHTFNSEDLYAGLRLILWGIFKKVVIADRLATYVNAVYADPGHYGWKNLVLAAVFFSFQVYADFSGYSDIARGTAKIMGFRLSLNFDTPFSSRSMADFWRRWHISLSSWYNEYLFRPLFSSLPPWGKWSVAISLFTTFVLSGLWHGAKWTFIVYGMIHGLALIVEYLSRSYRRKIFSVFPSGLMAPVFILLVFAFSSFSWIFFRANSISDALMILRHILQQQPAGLNQYTGLWLKGFGISSLVISALATAGMLYVENILKADPGSAWTKPVREIVFCAVVLALIFVIGVFHRDSFIYAQF